MSAHQYRKKTIIDTFNRAATTYDAVAVLPQEIAQRLIDHLEAINIEPKNILDLGAGTGYGVRLLKKRYPEANIIALDMAEKMLVKADQPRLCTDIENLALQTHSIDLIFSNLSLSWCHLGNAFAEIHRVLRPKGLFLFSMFGPDTLQEVRQSWSAIDAEMHVHLFFDMHDIGDALLRTKFLDPVMEMEYLTMTYPTMQDFFHEIKALGYSNILDARKKTLLGKKHWQRFVTELSKYQQNNRPLPATFEIIYGHAWGSERNQMEAGEVRISIKDIKIK